MARSKRVEDRRKAIAARRTQQSAPRGGAEPSGVDSDGPVATTVAADPLLDTVSTVSGSAEEMTAAVEAASGRIEDVPTYPIAAIAPHPDNPAGRIVVDDELIALGADIEARGLQQPAVIATRERIEADDPAAAERLPTGAKYVLIYGHRRWAACRHRGLDRIPALLRSGPCDPLAIADIFLSENFHRKTPDPLMEAGAYQRMRDAGLTTTQIAARRGVAQSHVSKSLKLLRLPEDVAAHVCSGALPRVDAYAYLDLPEQVRDQVFAEWLAAQERARQQPDAVAPTLRALARRAIAGGERTDAGDSDPASATGSRSDLSPTTGASWLEALPTLQVSATVRADILADALLCTPADALADTSWQAPVAAALRITLPDGEQPSPSEYRQPTWRRLALGRALWLLDRAAEQHDGDSAPAHVLRHRQRLAELGLTPSTGS